MWGAHSDGLCDPTAYVVSDQAGAIDAEQIKKHKQAIGVRFYVERVIGWRIAATKAEQIEDDDASTLREQRDQVLPQV